MSNKHSMKMFNNNKTVPGILFLFIMLLISRGDLCAQENKVFVDEKGILRWADSKEEAAFFGVNYAAPFAYSYRTLKKLGISVKEKIDTDVEHFVRLGFNAFRIHVWDREVSDKEGNLLNNEHIELLDYLIHKLKQKGIYTILTPIAWWGTGWPEPDLDTPGFSTFYTKEQMISESAAKLAQENYLKQFLNHINKYDNVSYKNDTSVIAFEIINEPHHPADTAFTSAYIKEMVSVIRGEGVTKPIYYNISENWPGNPGAGLDKVAVVYNAEIDGISFQWYPAGLVKRSRLVGNYLPHVDHYPIPDIKDKAFKNKSRMVYEFDAADVGESYMYPAMARSFKEAGMQWATMFCYDPSPLAAFNSEYQTHYLNLLYTPQKAISMLIAANVFKDVKAYQKFNSYPDNLKFDGYTISYEDNLAELNSETKLYYTNSTKSVPKSITQLEHIAGYGSSSVVQTNSHGSYFLDKVADKTWVLELYPDAVWVKDPFGMNSVERKVADLFYSKSDIKISLPDFNKGLYVYSSPGDDGVFYANAEGLSVAPGKYLLSSQKLSLNYLRNYFNKDDKTSLIKNSSIYVLPEKISSAYEGIPLKINAGIYSDKEIKKVQLFIRKAGWQRFTSIEMIKEGKYSYQAELPGMLLNNGLLEYYIYLETSDDSLVFPGGEKGYPNQWDYEPGELWKLKVIPKENNFVIFNPAEDYSNIVFPNIWGSADYSAGPATGKDNEDVYEIRINKINQPVKDITLQIEPDRLKNKTIFNNNTFNGLKFFITNNNAAIDTVYLRIVNNNCTAAAYKLTEFNKPVIALSSEFKPGDFVLLPRPYPHFLPYYYETTKAQGSVQLNMPGYLQLTIPLNGIGEKANGTIITIGKIELTKNNNTNSNNKNEEESHTNEQ